ncbi:tRNA (adenosine(37)-N6)-threonylcarbamoyltransferase complex dimerization subunit type 1 TsaB [Thalassobacillus hwangdonensis]|uniref:tRNA (Adenosine(37)-N6)-threonylcarbamoyltransferase complex dimerization subunit type 1 TsaB n=1 Tax=Thalassobacillus hwangdonensis TaxID=546108 RepID=A0ABW3L5L1_9BACI
MNVLAIDTSNQVLGVAVTKEGQLAGELVTNIKKNHSIRLMPAIDQLMKEAGMKPAELDRIVVAKGPGSYTGVRIGLTTAKTMAWSLGIPVVGISSLEVVARQGHFFDGYICPFFDARRGLVFTGLYDASMDIVKEETNIPLDQWLESLKELDRKILFLSQDIDLHRASIEEALGEQAVFADHASMNLPRPSMLIAAGEAKQPEDLHSFTPNYLRLAEAEAKWMEQHGKK